MKVYTIENVHLAWRGVDALVKYVSAKEDEALKLLPHGVWCGPKDPAKGLGCFIPWANIKNLLCASADLDGPTQKKDTSPRTRKAKPSKKPSA